MKSPLRACRGTGQPQFEQNAELKKESDERANVLMSALPLSHVTESESAKRLAPFEEPVAFRHL